MDNTIPVPTLGSKGWLYDLGESVNILFSHMFEADASITTVSRGTLTSFQELVKKYGNDPDSMVQYSTTAIENYLRKYIPECTVVIGQEPANPELDNGEYILKITITAYRNGETMDLTNYLQVSGSSFAKIVQYNNG